MFSERLGINVCIDNDSRAMAYGEYIMRSEKCPKNLIYVNVNWGLGLAIIIDGKLYSGMSGFAGEFGHNYGYDNQQICYCGKKGCIENGGILLGFVSEVYCPFASGRKLCVAEREIHR